MPVVEVHLDGPDTHQDNLTIVQNRSLILDSALGMLVKDLHKRKRLDQFARRKAKLKAANIKIRDCSASRDMWRQRTERLEEETRQLRERAEWAERELECSPDYGEMCLWAAPPMWILVPQKLHLTAPLLAVGVMVGTCSAEYLKEALESTPQRKVDSWVARVLGRSMQWFRRQFFSATNPEPVTIAG